MGDFVTRLARVYLPDRTFLLAMVEAFPALILLAWAMPPSPASHWYWFWHEGGLARIGAFALASFLSMYYADLYDWPALRSLRVAATRLPEALGTTCLLLAGLYLADPALGLRFATVLLAVATLGLSVALARLIHLALTRTSLLQRDIVVIGDAHLAAELAAIIGSRPELGLRLAAVAPGHSAATGISSASIRGTNGGSPGRGRSWHATSREDRDTFERAERNESDRGVEIYDGAALYESLTGKVWLDSADPLRRPLDRPHSRVSFFLAPGLSRTLAFACSLLALFLLAPAMALIALAIWMDSGRPVIFRQRRVGQGGRPFTLYKFRTMTQGPHGPFRPAEQNDRRFTRIGRWLRRTRLDELPQLWNILRGEMSFFGPRPFACEEEIEWAREIPWYSERWRVKPGATGWAQVRRGYCATREDNVEKLGYDLYYVKNQSIGLDLLILFETSKILLKWRGSR